ncbi:hypothetical protein Taro_001571 [Colocasia esculenta]|uniref:Uncharacterized protein n=1 Tax=Colocasia esculenta TaxID=4460 RepID=A0A843TGB3_COLES|nr:hypothetical protein [Colocasia esculenta]
MTSTAAITSSFSSSPSSSSLGGAALLLWMQMPFSRSSSRKILALPECVDTTRECVDTLSHLRKKILWELSLVSTLPLAVSTQCPSLATGSSGDWV